MHAPLGAVALFAASSCTIAGCASDQLPDQAPFTTVTLAVTTTEAAAGRDWIVWIAAPTVDGRPLRVLDSLVSRDPGTLSILIQDQASAQLPAGAYLQITGSGPTAFARTAEDDQADFPADLGWSGMRVESGTRLVPVGVAATPGGALGLAASLMIDGEDTDPYCSIEGGGVLPSAIDPATVEAPVMLPGGLCS